MRPLLLVLMVLLAGVVCAVPAGSEPMLIERSAADNVPGPILVPAAWAAAALGAGSAVVLASWAVSTAPSPGSFTAGAWATAALALTAAALEILFTAPDPPAPN